MQCRLYIADSLHLQAQNKYITARLSEILYPKEVDPEEEDADAIIQRTLEKLGIKVVEEKEGG